MHNYTFVLRGDFIPYVRMTRRGKFVSRRARAYLASQRVLAWQLRVQMLKHSWQTIAPGTALGITIIIRRKQRLHARDLDNEIKAILDACAGVVFADDRYIDHICATREQGEDERMVLRVTTPAEEEGEKPCLN